MALKCDCLGTTKYLVVPRRTPSALWVAFSPHSVFLIDAALRCYARVGYEYDLAQGLSLSLSSSHDGEVFDADVVKL